MQTVEVETTELHAKATYRHDLSNSSKAPGGTDEGSPEEQQKCVFFKMDSLQAGGADAPRTDGPTRRTANLIRWCVKSPTVTFTAAVTASRCVGAWRVGWLQNIVSYEAKGVYEKRPIAFGQSRGGTQAGAGPPKVFIVRQDPAHLPIRDALENEPPFSDASQPLTEGGQVAVSSEDDPIYSMPWSHPSDRLWKLTTSNGHAKFQMFLLAAREKDKSLVVLAGCEWEVCWNGRFESEPRWGWRPDNGATMLVVNETLTLPRERALLGLEALPWYTIGAHRFSPNHAEGSQNFQSSTDGASWGKHTDETDDEPPEALNEKKWAI